MVIIHNRQILGGVHYVPQFNLNSWSVLPFPRSIKCNVTMCLNLMNLIGELSVLHLKNST